jgi:spermidine synthase
MTTVGGPAARDRRRIVVVETGLVCFALVLSFCFSRDTLMQSITPSQAYAVVLPLLLVAGFLTGAEFPLAASILGGGGVDTERAGFVYGADLMGGWLGGIIGGAVLLPFFGAAPTCLLLGGLKMGSLLVLRSSFSADNKAVL